MKFSKDSKISNSIWFPSVFMLMGLLSIANVCPSAELIWMQKADMPTPRWTHTSAVVNGKIYVIGGFTSEGPGERTLSTVEEYDPVTDTWTRKADMPTARCDFVGSSAVVDGKVYVIGGDIYDGNYRCISTVEEYDPVTDTWTRKADMPTPRWSLATCALDGKIYAIGGAPDSITGLNVVEQYDPITDTWTREANMPTGVWGLCARVVSGKIYAIGGRPRLEAQPYVQEYDPATDTWTRKADMPVGTSQMGSVVLDGRIIVIGGWLHSWNNPYTAVQMYDPETDIWTTEADVPFLRACFSAEVVKNRIYAIGGTDRPHPCPALSTVYEFGPMLDFNWDGIANWADMCTMLAHWGDNYRLCDVGPTLLGDSIVDFRDLAVLSEYWLEEVLPFELVAYWRLDETEGDTAHDSIGESDGSVHGDPIWQPASGKRKGALRLDGLDDYVSVPLVLDTQARPFSVFVWVKGGMPGQVIFSQASRSDWLLADTTDGSLMTDLTFYGKASRPLVSQTVITDDNWHHVGLVWDEPNRTLYVDGEEVASDTYETGSLYLIGDLQIGVGKGLDPASFWLGLIDDVRIYDCAIMP